MHDIKYIRNNFSEFKKQVNNRNTEVNLDKILELDNKNCKFMMSNAKVDLVTNKFKEYNIYNIIAKRAINSKNPGSKTMEVLIQNYI